MPVHSSERNSCALSEHVTVPFESVAFAKIYLPIIGLLKMDKSNISVILNKRRYWLMVEE